MRNKTGVLLRGFVSRLRPGQEFLFSNVYKKLSADDGFDPEHLSRAFDSFSAEGLIELLPVPLLWRRAVKESTPADSKLEIKGLLGAYLPSPHGTLSARFVIPPLSVLDSRSGIWRSRRLQWLRSGMCSEAGRSSNLLGAGLGRGGKLWAHSGTSVFDPVLCEIVYRWFSPSDGQVVDPFAGGSVRGLVAGDLLRKYWGCDLSTRQVEENRRQVMLVKPALLPEYGIGDAAAALPTSPRADLVFSCPPYGSLEKYSDDPDDLSNMEHEAMLKKYGTIIKLAAERLKSNRFFVFVVGDFRGKDGVLKDFPADTTRACLAAGLKLYNSMIFIQGNASATLRAAKQFGASRKVVAAHQNVLVFVKGDWKKAVEVCKGGRATSSSCGSSSVHIAEEE